MLDATHLFHKGKDKDTMYPNTHQAQYTLLAGPQQVGLMAGTRNNWGSGGGTTCMLIFLVYSSILQPNLQPAIMRQAATCSASRMQAGTPNNCLHSHAASCWLLGYSAQLIIVHCPKHRHNHQAEWGSGKHTVVEGAEAP